MTDPLSGSLSNTHVYIQFNTVDGAWTQTPVFPDGRFSAYVGYMAPGLHVAFAFAMDGLEAGADSETFDASLLGNVASFIFVR